MVQLFLEVVIDDEVRLSDLASLGLLRLLSVFLWAQ